MQENRWLDQYFDILKEYISTGEEKILLAAADLSRELTVQGFPPEDFIEIHAGAISRLSEEIEDTSSLGTARNITQPLMEMLMTVIMAYRARHEELVREITERKRAEEMLNRSEARLSAILESAADAIMTIDSAGKIQSWNAAAGDIFGYSKDEIRGTPAALLIPERFRSAHGKGMVRLASAGETKIMGEVVELHGLRKDGSEFPSELSISAWEVGEEGYFTAIIRDISERKQKEDELRRINEELQQFANVASHDLQEPLRMVTSYLQLLQKRYGAQLDQEADEFIDFAVSGAQRMKTLINDLLSYFHIGGKSFDQTDMGVVLDKVLSTFKIPIKDNDAVVTCDPMPVIRADEGQIFQLFQNLIGNALKFRNDAPPEIHIGVEHLDDNWKFSIHDNGIGIDPQYSERIFVIFERLHTNDKYEGTGIGLAICKRIVERHGGNIWVESKPGYGSVFNFTIPSRSE